MARDAAEVAAEQEAEIREAMNRPACPERYTYGHDGDPPDPVRLAQERTAEARYGNRS